VGCMVKLCVLMMSHIAAFGALEGSVLAHTCIMPFQIVQFFIS